MDKNLFISIGKRIARFWKRFELGASRVIKLIITAGTIESAKFVWQWYSKKEIVSVRPRNIRFPINCRKSDSDYHVLWHVFGEKDCEVKLDRVPKFIIDGGAYVGYSSIYFANKYPNATIIAVEPDRENYELLCKNAKPYPTIIPVYAALWSSNVNLRVVNPSDQSWALKFKPVTTSKADNSITSITIPEIINSFGFDFIDLLKLDVEGAELELLKPSKSHWMDIVNAMIVEPHGIQAENLMHSISINHKFKISRNGEKFIFIRYRDNQ